MIKEIRHTGIVVRDLKASLHFYEHLLGFRVVRPMEESGEHMDTLLNLRDVRVTTIKMTAPDGQMIELLQFPSHRREQRSREICDIGISHIALTVDNLDLAYERLSKAGVPFNSAPHLSPDGYAKLTFCRAPEGTFIELVEVL